jgi:hypothetical protein
MRIFVLRLNQIPHVLAICMQLINQFSQITLLTIYLSCMYCPFGGDYYKSHLCLRLLQIAAKLSHTEPHVLIRYVQEFKFKLNCLMKMVRMAHALQTEAKLRPLVMVLS